MMARFTVVKKADLPKTRRGRTSKYQPIVDKLLSLKEDEALLVSFDEGESTSALRYAAKAAGLRIRIRKNPNAADSWYVSVAAEAQMPCPPPRAEWDDDKFFRKAREQAPSEGVPLITQLYKFVTTESEAWEWGSGEIEGTLKWRTWVRGKPFTVFDVSTSGKLGFSFGSYPEDVVDSLGDGFGQRLNQISGLVIESEQMRPGKFPTFPLLEVFQEEKDLELFKDAIRWFVSQIKAQEGPSSAG